MPQRHQFEVIVGNIGTVYSGGSRSEAMKKFTTYRLQSKAGTDRRHGKASGWGRAAGESVTLMEDGEPIKEHFGTQNEYENPAGIRAQVRRLSSGLIQLKIPLRSQNPASVAEAMQAVRKLGRRVKSAVVIGGTKVRSYIGKPKSKRKR